MQETKNYLELTHEELLLEEKSIKRKEVIAAFLIGFLASVMVYGIAKNGIGFLYIVIPSVMIYGIYKHSKTLKEELQQIRVLLETKEN